MTPSDSSAVSRRASEGFVWRSPAWDDASTKVQSWAREWERGAPAVATPNVLSVAPDPLKRAVSAAPMLCAWLFARASTHRRGASTPKAVPAAPDWEKNRQSTRGDFQASLRSDEELFTAGRCCLSQLA